MTLFRIRSYGKDVETASFRCGQSPLDEYIRRYAAQDVRRNLARVFVATPDGDASLLAGFYTLSAGSVNCAEMPESLARKLPRYPVPVALIGRLAVDERFHGQGLGAILLADTCRKVLNASVTLAVAGIVVDAKDEMAAGFYRHFGFLPLPGQPGRLLMPAAVFRAYVKSDELAN